MINATYFISVERDEYPGDSIESQLKLSLQYLYSTLVMFAFFPQKKRKNEQKQINQLVHKHCQPKHYDWGKKLLNCVYQYFQ